ncbi:MAG TPA: MFS transporter [Edaphobacter sp.]|nr:MFS transporter [Edaphobacter sp.]
MQATHAQSDLTLSRMEIRALALASLGGALEFYDFVVFVFFTTAIGKLFFAASLPDWVRQFQTFGIFAAGYLARPLGGIVMGHFGDTRGRKRMFTLSVLLMAIPTLTIGLLPTYQSIGVAAPLLLLTMRIMQGIAIGGEAPGGWVFVAEHARRGRSGFAIGLLTCGLTAGILLGSIVATGLNLAYTSAQIVNGIWRVPFVLGGIFGFIAMFLRRWLEETPVFEELRARAAVSREVPLRTVLARHGRAILASVISTWALTAAIVVVILMSPALLQKLFAITPRNAQMANLVGTLTLCISTVVVGAATDRFGIRRVAVPSLLLLIAATYGLYAGAAETPSKLVLLYAIAGLAAGAVTLTPVLMVRAFPSAIRFSGVSFSYNIAYAIFGGITPLLISWLVHYNRFSPAHYVAAISVLGILSTFIIPTIDSLEVRG